MCPPQKKGIIRIFTTDFVLVKKKWTQIKGTHSCEEIVI